MENFENPTIGEQNNNADDGILFRDGDFTPRDRAIAAQQYERMLSRGSWQFREAETVARQMVNDYETDHDTAELWDK